MLRVDVRKQLRDFEQRVAFELERGEVLLVGGHGGRGAFLEQLAGLPTCRTREFLGPDGTLLSQRNQGEVPIRPDEGVITFDGEVWFRSESQGAPVCLTMAERGVSFKARSDSWLKSDVPPDTRLIVLDEGGNDPKWREYARETGRCIVFSSNVYGADQTVDWECVLFHDRPSEVRRVPRREDRPCRRRGSEGPWPAKLRGVRDGA